MPVHHRTFADPYSGDETGDSSEIETSTRLDVLWEVHVPGWEPYQLHEVRKSPLWATADHLLGTGNRFYKVRLRRGHGFLKELGAPCLVDPEDPHRLWIDWDAAFDEHEPAWDRMSAVEREVNKRKGVWDHALGRVFDPFAPKLREEDMHLADEQLVKEKAREEQQVAAALDHADAMAKANGTWTSPEEQQRFNDINADLARIYETGNPTTATVVSIAKTGRTVANIPEFEIHLDVHDVEPARRLVHLQVMGDNRFFLRRFKRGKVLDVHVDGEDVGRICIG